MSTEGGPGGAPEASAEDAREELSREAEQIGLVDKWKNRGGAKGLGPVLVTVGAKALGLVLVTAGAKAWAGPGWPWAAGSGHQSSASVIY